jgi:hypothetical protein
MRHLKLVCVTLVAIFVLSITATSTFALLPDISVALEGTSYPIHMNFTDNGKTPTKLETTGGNKLEGKGLLVLLLSEKELSALGTFEALFLNVKEGAKECNSKGDKKEEILTTGTYHIVYPTLAPLTIGVAFLVKEVEIECAKVKIKLKGCALALITHPQNSNEDVMLMTLALLGAKGKNEHTEYENDSGSIVKCILEANFGPGFLQADEAVGESIHLTTLANNMFTISNI